MYIGRKDKKSFWDSDQFLKSLLPNWKKWQKAYKNRIANYTPRVKPLHGDVKVDNIIEDWDPKKSKGTSQLKSVMISPMFGPDRVKDYKAFNEAYSPTAHIKTVDAAESLRTIVGLDLAFMIGCDHEWEQVCDDGEGDGVLHAGRAGDDADTPATPDPVQDRNDPHDFTKWDICNLATIPLSELVFAPDVTQSKVFHAALLLCYMSDEIERLHTELASTLHAGYQIRFQRTPEATDLQRYPSIGANAYNEEEVRWCQATFDFLASSMDDEGRTKRNLPPARRRAPRGAAAAAAPPAARAAPSTKKGARAAPPPDDGGGEIETESDDEGATRAGRKRPVR